MEKKYKIATLGCRTNQYESEGYASQLRTLGYSEAVDGESAEICIVNTCTVTASADSHSLHAIRSLRRENPGAKLVVTGCLTEKLQGHKEIDHIVPNSEKERLLEHLFPEEELPEFKIDHFGGHTRPFVKVQDGCNSFCSYCIIPYVRGRSRSRPVSEIIAEIRGLLDQGYQEVVLTGINIGDFSQEGGYKLADLVREVDSLDGLKRLRVSSIDPDEVDDDLLSAIISGRRTMPSMHVVLQSGSNAVLKRMNRKYTRQVFLETVRRLKAARSSFTITTDIIVGFPGESEGDFEETLEVMREVKFAKVHMFPYSERARTRAALFPGKIAPEVIAKRKQRVLREAERLAFEAREGFVGEQVLVLTEEDNFGHTENFLPVRLLGERVAKNREVRVKCLANTAQGLEGVIV